MTDIRKIDRQRMEDLFAEIERRLNFLKELVKMQEVRFLTDHLISSAAERDLQVAIEACMDISRHLIAKIPLEKPKKENKEMFLILSRHAIISETLAKKLFYMAGMRNILVHQYTEIQREKIYHAIKYELSDIEEFISQIQKFLDTLQ